MHSTKYVSHVTVTCSCITKAGEYGDRPQTIFCSVNHSRIGLGMSLAIRRNLHLATNTRKRSTHNLIDGLMYGLSVTPFHTGIIIKIMSKIWHSHRQVYQDWIQIKT